jgi:hypothetical protein
MQESDKIILIKIIIDYEISRITPKIIKINPADKQNNRIKIKNLIAKTPLINNKKLNIINILNLI